MIENSVPLRSQWTISRGKGHEVDWCAKLMSENDPWITLGRTYEQCRQRCHHPQLELYLARNKSEMPGGFILVDPRGVIGHPYIASIAVAREFRCEGLGRRMVEFVEAIYQPKPRFLFLCVSSFNERAQLLYTRLGFRKVGLMDDFVVDGLGEWLMMKRLQ